jgi:hypothetical protein
MDQPERTLRYTHRSEKLDTPSDYMWSMEHAGAGITVREDSVSGQQRDADEQWYGGLVTVQRGLCICG